MNKPNQTGIDTNDSGWFPVTTQAVNETIEAQRILDTFRYKISDVGLLGYKKLINKYNPKK